MQLLATGSRKLCRAAPVTGLIPRTDALEIHGNHADVYAQRSAGTFLLTLLGQ